MSNRRSSRELSKKKDAFDGVFEWAERAFCPSAMKNYQPEPEVDTLDYVFEKVESFTCQQEEEPEPSTFYPEHDIKRDNSLVEADDYGRPVHVETERRIKPLGEHGDFVDYVFEHVESIVCNEDIPDDAAVKRSMAVTPDREDCREARTRVENLYEPEEEIQLYFRPQRSKKKKRSSNSGRHVRRGEI